MTELPEKINAIKTITYDVAGIVESLVGENDIRPDEITIDMIMDKIEDWVEEDFAHDVADVTIYQDENGTEILA